MRRLRVDRIDLHLKNVPAATAREAARLLGPALAEAFAASAARGNGAAAESNDGGRASPPSAHDGGHLAIGADTDPGTMATGIAHRIAAQTRRRG